MNILTIKDDDIITNLSPYSTEEFVTTMTMAKGEYYGRTGTYIHNARLYGWNNVVMVWEIEDINGKIARVIIKRRR